MTDKTLSSLSASVDFTKHRLVIVDNGSWIKTTEIYEKWIEIFNERWGYTNTGKSPENPALKIIFIGENIGTARAINKAWELREPGEHCVKMDNDVVIHQEGWLDLLEEIVQRDSSYGILGLKRKDCIETPWHKDDWYRSKLKMTPHVSGQRWILVDEVHHVMGTCQMYSSLCLDKIGYLYQMGGLYGFDDALASIRAQVAGFRTAHVPHIEIDHIDPGGDSYQQWKTKYSGERMDVFHNYKRAYQQGSLPVYHGPDDE
jgi:GT2 family glycosyltransferase